MQNINGGAGGTANASLNLTGGDNFSISVEANDTSSPGSGSSITGGADGFTAGAGGNAFASSVDFETNLNAGHSGVTVNCIAEGQAGGGILTGVQGNGGAGGMGTASAQANNSGPDLIEVVSSAVGGGGGGGIGAGFQAGNGGNASASAQATSTAGPASAFVIAIGGTAGAGTNGASLGIGGNAAASARASGINVVHATATASAVSGTATADSFATSTFGRISSLESKASADVAGVTTADTTSQLGQSLPNLSDIYSIPAAAYSFGIPQSSDVLGLWASNTNVRNAFTNNPGNVDLVGLTNVFLQGGPSYTYTASIDVMEPGSNYSPNSLLLGSTNPQIIGLSNNLLRFRAISVTQ